MKKILVTGAGGFIGSHLTELLWAEGYTVKAFVRYNSKSHWGWLEESLCKNEIEIYSGDIRDFDSVYNAVQGMDTVFHLAALIGIPYSYSSPLAYLKTNMEGTYNVLEAARRLHLENVLITSTSETYGSAQYVPIDERHPAVGQSPYSATKIGADQLALSYSRSFHLPVKVVRPFNTFGPRQSARAIIPTIIIQILNRPKELILGNLHPVRDFTFVKDTVGGFLEIAKSERLFGEVVNIGTNQGVSMGALVEKIMSLMGVSIDIKSDAKRGRPDSSEVDRLLCNNEKILSTTNWRPRYGLEQGLEETIAWLKHHRDLYKADLYNV